MRIGLLFPGQGSQFVGMGQELYNKLPTAKRLINTSNEILGFDLKNIIFNGTDEDLTLTEIAQPAIFVVSAMYFEKFKKMEESFEVAAGHSLGEYSALYAANVISFEDCLRLVRKRGLAMKEQNSLGTMFAIMGVDLEYITNSIGEFNKKVVIANVNSKSQIVISGYKEETIKVAEKLSRINGSKVKQLNVSSAFHSPLMNDAKKIMEYEIDKVCFKKPSSSIIPNVLGYATDDINTIKNSLKEQVTGQVKWFDTIICMKDFGIEKLYEVGPGEVLKKLNKTIIFRPKCESL